MPARGARRALLAACLSLCCVVVHAQQPQSDAAATRQAVAPAAKRQAHGPAVAAHKRHGKARAVAKARRPRQVAPALVQASEQASVVIANGAARPGDVVGRGTASWYGPRLHGRRTANGERYDMHGLTAAHPTLPFGTVLDVRSLVNDREVRVRINDRGPHIRGRIIDLSREAAVALGMVHDGRGTKPVVLTVVEMPGANVRRGDVVEPETDVQSREIPQAAPTQALPQETGAPDRATSAAAVEDASSTQVVPGLLQAP
ncbi:MAG TPA: septal ring lytic transglycosylase RlpA family protein [Ramlibacter sp.]|nr:septal ring lytic transglycosylase RlpA family protein [Ramlibacter sp.]